MNKMLVLFLFGMCISCKSEEMTSETIRMKVLKTWSTSNTTGDILQTSTGHNYCLRGVDSNDRHRVICSSNDDNIKSIMGLDGLNVELKIKVKEKNSGYIDTFDAINTKVLK
jgi:hypothetical protein